MSNALIRSVVIALTLSLCLASPAAMAEEAFVSDLDLSKTQQDWGSAKKDRSVDNNALTMAGKTYARGVGTHAASRLMIDLGGGATRFTAVVGLDDETGAQAAPVIFRLNADGKTIWTSKTIAAGQPPEAADVDVSGVKQLTLAVDAAGDTIRSAHANWADAKITYAGRAPVAIDAPVPAAEILTPPPPAEPRINGATVFGVRPGNPLLYTIPATGERPMTFAAAGLPAGVSLDPVTGRLSGSVAEAGEHVVTLTARNARGENQRKFRIVVGETIALTPPLGWNSWNIWGERVDQEKVLGAARSLVSSGLINHGWTYVNIDDTWQGQRGGEFNAIQAHPERFPDMKALCDQVHAMGLKIGIYSSPWIETYAGRIGGSADNPQGAWQQSDRKTPKHTQTKPYAVGQYSFASNDAKQWAAWGIDYLKYDWGPVDVKNAAEMRDALRASGRDIVYSLSNNAPGNVLGLMPEIGQIANAWRTTGDIIDTWRSVRDIGFRQDAWASSQKPGHYNDPDMLVVGHVGWGRPHPTRLKPAEQYAHMSLWALLGGPLLIGADLEKLDAFTIGLLGNNEVIAVNQDALCRQGTTAISRGDLRVYTKDLEDGSVAVGLFNLGRDEQTFSVSLDELKRPGPQAVRDLWRQKDLGTFTGNYQTAIPSHGAVLLRLTAQK
jgi:alpha-galactosidase